MPKKRQILPPPAWLVVGARVDYCSIIGREPTQRAMVVSSGPEQLVSDHWVVWLEGKAACVAIEACLPAKAAT